ncbi:hypothetical protein K504DRAFT_502839 [Pleomassaria siparia CBS 279.74]|uniref:Rhodopsin domain-containing protein n=1 Tax=Pleomassaria siparia CBS 279.74 TaxID=1314801 RepID=A0A6G1K7N5_9PLEO|nr:hypothetical protein K504DRAFT_502839 [Pleomassaria siparia CBS 279.74]
MTQLMTVSKLHIRTSKKITISASFSLGFPAGVATLYKLTTIQSLINQGDPTFATVPLDLWNCVECIALIIAATIPMTRPVMALAGRQFKDVVFRISGKSSTSGRGTSKTGKDIIITLTSPPKLNRFSQRSGYRAQKSNDDILLQEENRVEDVYLSRKASYSVPSWEAELSGSVMVRSRNPSQQEFPAHQIRVDFDLDLDR